MSVRALLVACLLLGCRAGQSEHADGQVQDSPAIIEEPDGGPKPLARTIAAQRGVAHAEALTEIVLDPRAEAALTLDESGSVRLWPKLRAETTGEAHLPWSLPFEEPVWMSLARGDEGFTVGFIDTTNGAQVWQLRIIEAGEAGEAGEATILRRFEIPPTDPLLELHVLDGGERILALGIDHRLRLYDLDGRLLSQIDEHGFAPWQLRITGGDGREPLHLAVTLARPLRVQAIALEGDRLARVGEPRELALDRGPNRNDLALSPDGRFIAALRRRKARGRDWSVELINLDSGERRLIGGRIETEFRPRMHLLPGDRMLLESGDGHGHMVDLTQAVVFRRRSHAEPDSTLAKRLSRSMTHALVSLPGSGEPAWSGRNAETGLRYHASVVGDVRVALMEEQCEFVVHSLDAPEQLVFEAAGHDILVASVDASGEYLVWVTPRRIHVERVDGQGQAIDLPYQVDNPSRVEAVAFVDAGKVIIDHYDGPGEIIELATGVRSEYSGATDDVVKQTHSVSFSVAEGTPSLRVEWSFLSKDKPQWVTVRPTGGDEAWEHHVESIATMATAGGRFVLNTGRRVHVFELDSGALLGTRDDAELRVTRVETADE